MADINKCAVGVDVGGTNVRAACVTIDGRLENAVKISRREAFGDSGNENPARLGAFLAEYIKGCGKDVSAAGVGIPGTLDKSCRRIMNVPNISSLNNLPYADMLSDLTGIPVYLENDTVMLLTGDISSLSIRSDGLILGIYIGTGLGGTVFYKGRPLKGKNGLNEIGHIPLLGKNDKCSCGNTGCAENYISGRYLQRLREEKYPDVFIGDLFEAMSGSAELEEFIDTAGVIIASAVTLLDPDLVILGGGVVSMRGFPRCEIEASVRRHAMKPQPSEGLEIIYPPVSDYTGALGAGLYALQNI
jgi:allose kinase